MPMGDTPLFPAPPVTTSVRAFKVAGERVRWVMVPTAPEVEGRRLPEHLILELGRPATALYLSRSRSAPTLAQAFVEVPWQKPPNALLQAPGAQEALGFTMMALNLLAALVWK